MIKEPGGQVGDRARIVYGTPQFAAGERVLLYLASYPDGSLCVSFMCLGKLSITTDPETSQPLVVRMASDEDVTVLPQSSQTSSTDTTSYMALSAYTEMVRNKVAANWVKSQEIEALYYRDTPIRSTPQGYHPAEAGKDMKPQFSLIRSGYGVHIRWFRFDFGRTLGLYYNPQFAPDSDPQGAIAAAMNSWSSACNRVRLSIAGTTGDCGLDATNVISFNE